MELSSLPVPAVDPSLVAADQNEDATDPAAAGPPFSLDRGALWSLAAQHLSSSWGARAFDFAAFLFLIELFPSTVLPASIFGFASTSGAILFSGMVGNIVDTTPRLRMVRLGIVAQKATVAASYACFLALFLRLRDGRGAGKWALFAVVTLLAAGLNLSTIAISVAVERDWAVTMCQGDGASLTQLNTYLRRVDLLTALLTPLFVSMLTTAVSYPFAVAFLLGFSLLTMALEVFWIQVVYRRIPVLASEEVSRTSTRREDREQHKLAHAGMSMITRFAHHAGAIGPNLRSQAQDWAEFVRSPVFPSSLAISLLYMTVLSFDGTMISWLKSHTFSDPFIAGMRAVGVCTGLLGTLVMPIMEKRIGLVRAGSWSIVSELVSLAPAVLSFFVEAPREGERSSSWNAALLFTGMAFSRIGLWSFDLCQLKELQTHLQEHPRKNSIMALQFSLQNVFDLGKYTLTMVLHRPSQFRWAALVSFGAVCLASICYLAYAWKERGHLVHLKRKKQR